MQNASHSGQQGEEELTAPARTRFETDQAEELLNHWIVSPAGTTAPKLELGRPSSVLNGIGNQISCTSSICGV